MSTWSSHDKWYFAWPQVRCEGIGSTGHRHGSFRVYSMRRDAFDFGQHRGKPIDKVDNGYLEWMVNNFQESNPWWKAAVDALTRRGKVKRQQSAIRNVNVHDLLSDLKSCTRKKDLHKGKRVHSKAVETGNELNMYVAATLINMYAKCGSMIDARTVFDNIQEPDVVSWTAVILGYADSAEGLAALDLFSRMKDERRCLPDTTTYLAVLKACTSLAADGGETGKKRCLERGREIHLEIGCHMSQFVQSALMDMYAKCGSMVDAKRVFDSIQVPDVVSWTTLILGYVEDGQGLVALDCFSRMKEECRCAPDSMTYVSALKACTSLAADGDESGKKRCLERGREIHLEIGRHMNQFVQSTLIDMYAKCGSMVDARSMFDSIQEPDVVSWNAMILGYANSAQGLAALNLFSRMKDKCRCPPDSMTYLAALKACTSLAAEGDESEKKRCLKRGREIHLEIGCHMNQFVQSTLIDMYAKCGSMVDARSVFDNIQEPDVVSWNAVILGYADDGQGLVALDYFSRMKEYRCAPNCMTYVAVLKACGSNGALAIGRKFHLEIREFDTHVVTSLVDFYAKCGSMEEAREVFDLHPQARDVSTWNALLAGYGRFGNTHFVFSLFEVMQDQNFRPNAITFLCMLGCCSHAGLVEKAWKYLEVIMPTQYGLTPTVMHYTCMVDLMGRANKLDQAVALLQKMPYKPDVVTWMTLLGACRKWQNVEIGRMAFKSLVNLNQNKASAYILMAEIYGSRGMWEEQKRVLKIRKQSGACKLHGQAYVMDRMGRMVKFTVGKEDPIYIKDKLKQFLENIQEHEYVAKSYSMSHFIMDDDKDKALCGHSERRAVIYGILNTPCGEVIRVIKNMRICNDCHWLIKMISKLSGRVIMIRDESRFHVIENGNCSCEDYW